MKNLLMTKSNDLMSEITVHKLITITATGQIKMCKSSGKTTLSLCF